MILTNPLSVSEIGTLWQTYQEKTLIMRFLEYFIEKSDEQEARNILGGLWQELNFYVKEMEELFSDQGMVKPVGFTSADVNLEAPKLYDNGFDIMFLRVLKEVSMGLYTLNMNMTYNKKVLSIYEGLTTVTQKIYKLSTFYLLEKGILSLPPKVTMPKNIEYIKSKKYMDGFKLTGDKRALNDLEIGILHHNMEANNIGMQLITGFAQCAQNKEAKKYFLKGKELAKKQIKMMEEILLEGDVQFSATSGATVTTSTVPPFSDKLMMHCIYILNGFSLVGSGTGAFFSLRNDIAMKSMILAKDIYFYAQEGIKIKIKNGWFEEPPQMEDRPGLIRE
ncbi:DUF3231 family protein [Cytobacillus firmus]|uniref:DUF3231 family protein n=1 Tax=Cytobacillus firmus TaxID=1399 RepID=UPI0015808A01|nr:DUF3231 family protein [Cytobacillus firmus]MBG9656495.1 hypothetical protein [Cytobacillus firmus]MDD9313846.1 DUF3231 family protein [Cytobacillus firmus]MED1905413.1 DUF3231 family protein [Cytobacillus firmus]NUH85876.1 DUF3231 family protein [Cytobacillus firmus]